MWLLFLWGFFCCCNFGFVFTNMPTILIGLATTNGPFSEKNYIQNVQHVYSYTIIQGNSLIKYSLSMYRRLNTSGSVFFLAVFKIMRTKIFQREAGESSGGDGQVHVLLFGRGGRYGNVILLFLRAPRGRQGRAFAVM